MTTEVCDAGAAEINIEEKPLSKKAKEIGYGDLIIIRDRPYKVWGIVPPPTPGGRITLNCVDIFNGCRKIRCPSPDEYCKVPHVTRTDYQCTGYRKENVCAILVSDSGVTREDIKLPFDYILWRLIMIGLDAGRKTVVTVVSSMGEEHIRDVRYDS